MPPPPRALLLLLPAACLLLLASPGPGLLAARRGEEGGCACSRAPPRKWTVAIPPVRAGPAVPLNQTTCSPAAWRRGPGQRVVSFTFFQETKDSPKHSEHREYFQGIEANLRLVKEHYPGWQMRVYHDTGPDLLDRLCTLACTEPALDLCPATAVPRLGNASRLYPLLWRFLPALDPQVDAFLSRDLDSRVSAREAAAVSEFLASGASVHVMRDHPAHTAVIMGGMWGARLGGHTGSTRHRFKQAFAKMFKNAVAYISRLKGGWDQVALQRYVWPWAKRQTFAHDSYTCKRFSYTHPFPTRRLQGVGNYVGSVVAMGAEVTSTCPAKCRPRGHQDWTLC